MLLYITVLVVPIFQPWSTCIMLESSVRDLVSFFRSLPQRLAPLRNMGCISVRLLLVDSYSDDTTEMYRSAESPHFLQANINELHSLALCL